ncbi:MAG: methyltransferase [Nanoarchaeota archaeon]|nr:methyltransferase [Nanoarchaeota archaeon]MBU0962751.1 methyltransferase [Nanoarchaeota archaeon]
MYEPAEDSFLLKKYVLEYSKGKVLDIGCGSGILAEAALRKTKDVLASDIDSKAVKHCLKKGINAIESNLFSNIKGKFDLIIFNPPYLPEDPDEPEDSKLITTGGKKGYELIERFLKSARIHMKKEGKILLVCSSLTGNVEKLFKRHKYKFNKLETQKSFFEQIHVYLLH